MQNSDGRVALDKVKLKDHRRRLGLSQEQMALECAEKGLYVSIASLKRAEAEKRVLYRTARDISLFFDTSLESILKHSADPDANTSLKPASAQIDVHRTVVITHIIYDTALTSTSYEPAEEVRAILSEYSTNILSNTQHGLTLAPNAPQTDGNEPLRACYCAKQLLNVLPALIGRRCIAVITGQNDDAPEQPDCSPQAGTISRYFFPAASDDTTLHPRSFASIYVGDELEPIVTRHLSCQKWSQAPHPELSQFSAVTFEASDDAPQLALAGRQLELYQFRSVLESCKNYHSAQVFCLNGVAGIGKTRLLKEYAHIAKQEQYQYGELTALDVRGLHNAKLITQVVRKLLELDSSKPSSSGFEANSYRRRLSDHENRLLRSLENEHLDEDTQLSFGLMSHQELLDQQIQLCVKLTRHVCQHAPLLLCLEDLHWADQTALDFLAQWVPQIKDLPIIVLATHRPEEAIISAMSHLALMAPLTTVNLSPLTAQDAQFLAQQITGKPEYQQLCIEKAEGNPLFLEQLLRGDFDQSQQLPYTIQSLITAKVDQLEPEHKQAILAASVVGQKFSLDLVRYLIGNEQYQPLELVKRFLISPQGNSYAFNHALLCDGIYQSIQEEAKYELNKKCATWFASRDATLELRYLFRIKSDTIATKLPTTVEQLIKHYRYELALEFIDSALDSNIEGIDHYKTLYQKADIHNKLGRFDLTVTIADRALERAHNPADQVEVLLLKANALNTLDRFDDAMQALARAEEVANAYSMPNKLSRIYYLKGNFFFPKGNIELCSQNHKQALQSAKQAQDVEMQARALGGLCDAAYAGGKMYSAFGYVRECLELCENHELKAVEASNLFMLGTVRIYQNQARQALRDTLNGIELTQLVGHSRAEIVSRLTAAWIYIDMAEFYEAKHQVNTALALAESVGAKRFVPFLQESQARIEFFEGNAAQAQATITDALARIEELGAGKFIGPWVYATAALVTSNSREAKHYLTGGADLLAQGCIGHNYFRFYTLAMESSINRKDWGDLEHYKRQLEQYTASEPTPWSQYYIQRAALYLKAQATEVSEAEVKSLTLMAQEAGLITSIPALDDLIQTRITE